MVCGGDAAVLHIGEEVLPRGLALAGIVQRQNGKKAQNFLVFGF